MSDFDSADESSISSFDESLVEEDEQKEKEEESVADVDQATSAYVTPVPTKKKGDQIFISSPSSGEDMRRSSRAMTPFEYCRLISNRAVMISKNEPIHPKYRNVKTFDLIEIAQMELDDEDIPFPLDVYRPIDVPTLDAKIFEVFNPRELILPAKLLTQHIRDYLPKTSWTVKDQL